MSDILLLPLKPQLIQTAFRCLHIIYSKHVVLTEKKIFLRQWVFGHKQRPKETRRGI